MYKIYKLIDPLTKEIKYIGRTKQGILKRLNKHIKESSKLKTHKDKWINYLSKLNLKPLIEIIKDDIPSIEEADENEIYYIQFFKKNNCKLTNSTLGGGGAKGFKHSSEVIEFLKTLSHSHSNETKKNLSIIKTEFYKQKLSKTDNEIFEFILKNKQFSNREIAKHFNTNPMRIGRIKQRNMK